MIDNINAVCLQAGANIIEFKSLIDGVANALIGVIKTKCDVSNENPTRMIESLSKGEIDETKSVFEFLENSDNIIDVISENNNELNFTISDEQNGKLKGGMMMSAPIVINGVPIASLALVGPKRIDYANVAAALKFIVNQVDRGGNGE